MTDTLNSTDARENLAELYRVREGHNRIIYTAYDNDLIVLIVRIGHRSEVYR